MQEDTKPLLKKEDQQNYNAIENEDKQALRFKNQNNGFTDDLEESKNKFMRTNYAYVAIFAGLLFGL